MKQKTYLKTQIKKAENALLSPHHKKVAKNLKNLLKFKIKQKNLVKN